MKSKLVRYVGRSILTLVVTAMFTFGGLLVLTPNKDAHAHHKYSYTKCWACDDHDHKNN